jgi:hypothetical protein
MQAQFAAIRTRFAGTGVDFGSRQNGERGEILVAGGGGEFPILCNSRFLSRMQRDDRNRKGVGAIGAA